MKLVPTNNNIVIKLVKEDKTESGIILPGAKENSDFGIVDSVGPEVNNIKTGDKVVFNEEGKNVILDEEKYIIISQDNVLAIIE